jgi:recombination protein RecR
MPDFAEPLARLITEFKRLPGIGQKSAQRLAFHVLRGGRPDAERLTQAILDVKDRLGLCRICNNISDGEECQFCRDSGRDPKIVCVVEEPHDIVGIETTRQFSGQYHVLHGALSPLRGITPEQLKIKGLIDRIGGGLVEEVIVATNPTVEGEATAVYLSKLLKPLGIKVTRIAMGVPVTIWKAMEGRREM